MLYKFAILDDVVRFVGGGTPSKQNSSFWNGNIPWVSPKDMKSFYISGSVDSITDAGLRDSACNLIPPGSVLTVVRSGVLIHTLPVALTKVPCALNQDMKAMIPSAQLRSPFLAYWLLSKEQHILTTCVKKGATVQSIAMENLRSQELPLPPLPEQDRIVEILDLADALRQQRRQADALSQRILPALFQEMFGNPQVETIKSGERLGDYITESNYGLSAKANEDDTGIPMLRMNNVTYEGHLNLESLKYLNPNTPNLARSMLRKGDLLFNRTNSRELVGKTALWGPDISAVAASYLIIFRVDESKLLPEFVWAYMNMPFFKELLLNTARKAIGMANINSKEIAAFPIWKPPLDRQSHFKDAIARLEQSRKEQTTSAATLETLFQTLLHRAFDGSLTAKWREGQAKELLQEMERKVRQRS